MFGAQYYNGLLRKYVIMFGNLFNDIVVQRLDSNNNRVQAISVPIAYGPKEKFLVRISADPDLDRQVAVQLPRMGFEIQGLVYAPQRKLASSLKNVHIQDTDDGNVVKTQFVPVPYDINFMLSIFVKNADDGTQILEQIVPYFTPEWTSTVKVIPEMSISMDIPTTLQGITIEDTYEGDFDTRRAVIWNLDFLVKGYLYGPVTKSGIIKRAIVNYYVPPIKSTLYPSANTANNLIQQSEIGDSTLAQRVVLTPGLLANGSPTSNAAASISIAGINANDNWDYAFTTHTFTGNTG